MFDAHKYKPAPVPPRAARTWPDRTVTRPPIWCSVDLRDGNQALVEPMGIAAKLRLFETLVAIGFKEIEVGFPAASQIEWDFVRKLIEERRIPQDVTIQVLTQAREPLIERTVESLRGAERAIVHVYNSTNPTQRRVVFGMSRDQVRDLAVRGTRWVRQATEAVAETRFTLEYSPESFSATEVAFAVEVVQAVTEAWDPGPQRPMIVNLPATVEVSTPNVFADQVEWVHTHLPRRKDVVLSVHTHNDRGSAVAASELAMLAGAERVEGTLFGNGERTGNADVVTLAMNLYAAGVAPGLDFSNLPAVVEVAESCTRMAVPPRQPYAGELVFTAFSGSHQDAIAKGLAARERSGESTWDVPYLPIDPADVGRAYEPVIRINSQSGKGGISFVLEQSCGYRIPKEMAVELGSVVQAVTDRQGKELPSDAVREIFESTYVNVTGRFRLVGYDTHHAGAAACQLVATVRDGEVEVPVSGEGKGPIEAFMQALRKRFDVPADVGDYTEYALGRGAGAEAVAVVRVDGPRGKRWFGVGRDRDIVAASLGAVLSAINRSAR